MIFNTKIQELDTKEIVNSKYFNWEFFKNSTIMVTGATGLIGSQIVNAILYANEALDTNIKILALVRNKKKADQIFYANKTNKLKYVVQDILKPVKIRGKVDFIIHTANSTSSKSFADAPVETINSIVDGTNNILKFAQNKNVKGVIYLSSMEVYGTTDFERKEPLKEEDLGYIDLSNPRNSYPEGKRLAENLCLSYFKEFGLPVKIARLAQTLGAGVDYNDGRVFAQFARNIVEKQDIVLQTKGESIRSYCYITDAVAAIFALLEKGKDGECYNVANPDTTCSIKEMAEMLCEKYPTSKFRIELKENNFYLGRINYFLDITKLTKDTGFKSNVLLSDMYERLILKFQAKPKKYSKFSLLLKNIFSLTNLYNYKIIKIFGFVFKVEIVSDIEKYSKAKIQNNKILFTNYMGKNYGCNPKYITEEILKRKLPYDIVWLVKNSISKKDFPKGIRIVPFNSPKAIFEHMTSKVWFENHHKRYFIERGLEKSDEQYFIQSWHGSLGIKKIERDVPELVADQKWAEMAKKSSKMTDFWISNSAFETNIYKNSFWNVKEIKEFGHPRNDIFFKSEDEIEHIKNKIIKNLKLDKNSKILLYCPSFREDYNLDCYTLDTELLQKTLTKKYGGNWTILIRLHQNIMDKSKNLFKFSSNIKNASFYPDIQELLAVSDIAITDYSSCIFDFMLSRKPGFIFATDIEKYDNERGFYYPLTSTPFPVATNNEELIENIKNFDNEKYRKNVEEFLKEKGCMEDGHASERVVDLIEDLMRN